MPRKLRNPKPRIDGVSETAFWFLGDRKLYPKPETPDTWEELGLECLPAKRAAAWAICKDVILRDWRKKFKKGSPTAAREFGT